MRKAQKNRDSVEQRYDLAWQVMTGTSIDCGECAILSEGSVQSYGDDDARQSLCMLTKLRNALVHLKSERTEIRHEHSEKSIWRLTVERAVQHPEDKSWRRFEDTIKFLECKGLLADGDDCQRWSYRVCSAGVANWACDTVEKLAAKLVSHAPQLSSYLDYKQTLLEEQSLAAKPDKRLIELGRRLEDK